VGRELLGHLLERADGIARRAAEGRVQTVELGLDILAVIRQQFSDVHQLPRHHPPGDSQPREEDQDHQNNRDRAAKPPALQQRDRRREQEVQHQRECHRRQQVPGEVKREDDQAHEQQRLAGQEASTLPGWR